MLQNDILYDDDTNMISGKKKLTISCKWKIKCPIVIFVQKYL